jgi:hypothetical protein
MVQKLLTVPGLNRLLRSGRKGRKEVFLESSFFPAFQTLFPGVPRALSDQRKRAVRFFTRGPKQSDKTVGQKIWAPEKV